MPTSPPLCSASVLIALLFAVVGSTVCFAADISPTQIAVSPDGTQIYTICRDASTIAVVSAHSNTGLRWFATSPYPTSIVAVDNGAAIIVASGLGDGVLEKIDVTNGEVIIRVTAGHSPTGLSLSPDGARLFVCDRFASMLYEYDTRTLERLHEYTVGREPVASVAIADAVFVACFLPNDPNAYPDDLMRVVECSSRVTCVDRSTGNITAIPLISGCHSLRAMTLSPDGHYLYITGNIARFHSPTVRVERGWINTNALHIVDVTSRSYLNSVLLDEPLLGAANPAGITCTADGKTIAIAIGGTHEVMLIDNDRLWERLGRLPYNSPGLSVSSYWGHDVARMTSEVPNDLSFLDGIRRRIALPGQGACGVVNAGNQLWVSLTFADTIVAIDRYGGKESDIAISQCSLGNGNEPDARRRGERAWNDATLCKEQWLSCATCHPDARTDGLSWDLLNDGIGNPKTVKSMLGASFTPPAMWHGVRKSAEEAIRTGFQYIQFVDPDEAACSDIEVYLRSLQPVPSPFLVSGAMSTSAERGQVLFEERLGCTICHTAPRWTDLKKHNVESRSPVDRLATFDTPSLVEIWRTAPYLHDGRYVSLRDLFEHHDHGVTTATLSEEQITDLVNYLLSL